MNVQRRQSDLAIYRRLLREAKPFWPNIAALFALSWLSTPLIVSQEPVLVSSYAKPDATEAEIIAAAHPANLVA